MIKSAEEVSGGFAAIARLPVAKILALAVAAWGVLLVPADYAVIPSATLQAFRGAWGGLILLVAVTLSLLAAFSMAAASFAWVKRWVTKIAASGSLSIELDEGSARWHLTEQSDGTYSSQISLRLHFLNRRRAPVKVIAVSLLKPKSRGPVFCDLLLPLEGSPYHDPNHPVLAGNPVWGPLHFTARGQLGFQGESLKASFELRDDRGARYKFRNVKVASGDMSPGRPSIHRRFMHLWKDERGPKRVLTTGLDWDWSDNQATSSTLEALDLVLQEEQRQYRAKGRREGKLGSFNTGLQSGPNLGWTKAGEAPELLWPKGEAEAVSSPSVDRILRLYEREDYAGRADLERRLLNFLHRGAPFHDVSYAIFLALHRFGQTSPALTKAREDLQGAQSFALSNLYGCLAAIVSREHSDMSMAEIDELRRILSCGEKPEFSIPEMLNLARVIKQDA